MTLDDRSIHGSAVMIGDRGVLIRGPSGAGKSLLAFDLILAGRAGILPQVSLIGDARLLLRLDGPMLTARPAPALAGLLEIRGLGIRRTTFIAEGALSLVVDLAASDGARLPAPETRRTAIAGVELPRIAVAAGYDALPLVVAWFVTEDVEPARSPPA